MTAPIPPGSIPSGVMPPSDAVGKADLRRTLLATRRALPSQVRAAAEQAIGTRVVQWCRESGTPRLGVYWPIRHEPDLHATYALLVENGIELALPVVVAANAPLEFARWQPGDEMVQDRFGVAIPKTSEYIARPPALLIPCVGFNTERFRLGYGGGFYDRTLATGPRPHTLGVAFACQMAEFAAATHDVALDAIATEASLII